MMGLIYEYTLQSVRISLCPSEKLISSSFMGGNNDELIVNWIHVARPLSTANSWTSGQSVVHVLCQGDQGGNDNKDAGWV